MISIKLINCFTFTMPLIKTSQVILLLFVFIINTNQLSSSLNTDGLALLALKAAITRDPTRVLHSWSESDVTPCNWHGITCIDYVVTSLSLPNKDLTGYIPFELGLLDSLTKLDLSYNNFSRTIPSQLFNATNLNFIDLSHNSLYGQIPDQIKSLTQLSHMDFSSNFLNGSLPESLIELRSLSGTMNLSYNEFSGEIPVSYGRFPVTVSLDLRHNNLSGKVPLVGSLVNQGPTAFAGNPSLCGFPLTSPCPEAVNIPGSESSVNPENPGDTKKTTFYNGHVEKEKTKNGSVAVPLISGLTVVIGAVFVSVWLVRRQWGADSDENGNMVKEEKNVTKDDTVTEFSEEGQNGKFVAIDEGFNMDLEDLLRASAHMVGKSKSGILYKVVVGGKGSSTIVPTVVAVKRLSEGDATWRFKEFESEVEAIGRVQHPNIVRLKAYYYASDEKLLVTDFIRNGSLYTALHERGPSRSLPPLSWTARLKIAQGTARGLMYIHECSPRKHVHGNLKSSKVLLDDELQPYISGFGLNRLVCSTSKLTASASRKQYTTSQTSSNFYSAPEAHAFGSKLTQKFDVYAFGVILMELLTGRSPDAGVEENSRGLENLVRKFFHEERPLSDIIDPALLTEVNAKKQIVAAFHIALNCTELDPELRPRMRIVSNSLDRIKLQ